MKNLPQIKLGDKILGAITQSLNWKYRLFFFYIYLLNFPSVPIFLPILL